MEQTKGPHGFASLDPATVRALASKGGKAAHALRRAHRWTSAEAVAAGRKGGQARGRRRLAPQRAERP